MDEHGPATAVSEKLYVLARSLAALFIFNAIFEADVMT